MVKKGEKVIETTLKQKINSNLRIKYKNHGIDLINKIGDKKIHDIQHWVWFNLLVHSNYYDCDEFIKISGTKGMMWLNQCTCGGNFLSKTPPFPPIVVYSDGKVKVYGKDLPRDWRFSFINSTEHFINIVLKGGKPIYTGEQGRDLCIFAKMPYISSQQNRPVYWHEITPENEKNQSCIVESPVDVDGNTIRKYFRSIRLDLNKGVEGGLVHKDFKYQYEE